MCDKTVLETITKKICIAAKEVLGGKLEKVVLFGSYARGDYREDSDIDIMILADIALEEESKTRRKIRGLMDHIDLEYNVLVCLSVTCSSNFYNWINVLPFYMNVQKEGVELYA
ncbi:MAG: nucleotidyltransferase domain-containing protein [Chitinispirillales bacterium]|jgi:predicted nucleotidyltransferase|nr:nucleotidyltransferase domain-containing protein [Chitinispirillales bacterium]